MMTRPAAHINRMTELLEVEGANPFRIRACRQTAATVEDLPENVTVMVAGDCPLSGLPGTGEDLAGKSSRSRFIR